MARTIYLVEVLFYRYDRKRMYIYSCLTCINITGITVHSKVSLGRIWYCLKHQYQIRTRTHTSVPFNFHFQNNNRIQKQVSQQGFTIVHQSAVMRGEVERYLKLVPHLSGNAPFAGKKNIPVQLQFRTFTLNTAGNPINHQFLFSLKSNFCRKY